MRIGGVLDMSTVDYPGKISSVVFFHGCNFRCPFCYNVSLVEGEDYREVGTKDILGELKKNREFIDAVVMTGGEPTLQPEALEELSRQAKDLKLLVKLDTNGYTPDILRKLLKSGLLDFVSLDIKASPEKYNRLAGINCDLNKIKQSIQIIRNYGVEYELRTTIVPGQNDDPEDIRKICDFIGSSPYVLQQFRPEGGTLGKSLKAEKMDKNKLEKLAEISKERGLKVKIRTEEGGEEVV
ncbi:MAG: anaerobic ribonucleoside-triphosphate reductase activating protein [archaeon]|nr:MAG: anaerobic ribonucleoside-triphosphate reductase activating protein [archaeon]